MKQSERQFQSTNLQLNSCSVSLEFDWCLKIWTEDDKRIYAIQLPDGRIKKLNKNAVQVLSDYFAEVASEMKDPNGKT